MRYWDTSALTQLFARQSGWGIVQDWLAGDEAIVTSWLTPVECWSALTRLLRMGVLDEAGLAVSVGRLDEVLTDAHEVGSSPVLRDRAIEVLRGHALRAADAIHLASALQWCGHAPDRHEFVTFDRRLAEAARREGFVVLAEETSAG